MAIEALSKLIRVAVDEDYFLQTRQKIKSVGRVMGLTHGNERPTVFNGDSPRGPY